MSKQAAHVGDLEHIAQRATRAIALSRVLRLAAESETMGCEEIEAITFAIIHEMRDIQSVAREAVETIEAQAVQQ